jgi:hypothetical protein
MLAPIFHLSDLFKFANMQKKKNYHEKFINSHYCSRNAGKMSSNKDIDLLTVGDYLFLSVKMHQVSSSKTSGACRERNSELEMFK